VSWDWRVFPSHVFVFVLSLTLSPMLNVFVFIVVVVCFPNLLVLVFACFYHGGFLLRLILVRDMGLRIFRILLSRRSGIRPFLSRALDRILILLLVLVYSYNG